jgi:hypothetical protein
LPRVAHTLLFMYALRHHAQHPCPRVLTLACPGFLTVADSKDSSRRIGAMADRLTWRIACRYRLHHRLALRALIPPDVFEHGR